MRHYRPHCDVCRHVIRGRARRWSNRIMCRRCYSYFCKNVQKTSTTVRKLLGSTRSPQQPTRRSWLQRLFG